VSEFTKERFDRFKETVAKYERPECALLPTLYLAQEQFGYITAPVMEYVAKLLEIPPARVFEAVSFYTMFKKRDMGRWCLQICNNISCHMMGSEKVIQTAEEELGITLNETTEDKQFSLIRVECIGACDKAPVAQVNEKYLENLTPEKLKVIIGDLKKETFLGKREVI